MTTAYDLANRVNGVAGSLNSVNTTYVTTGVTYAPHGAPFTYSYGNTLYRNYTYTSRLQPYTASDSVQNNPGNTHLSMTWHWGTTNNNGDLQSMTTSHGGPNYPQFLTFNDTFVYDTVNRLGAVYDTDANNNSLYARIFNYDAYGNMSVKVNSGVPLYGTTPIWSTNYNLFNPATNRLLSARYDAAGNQTEVGSYSLAYDAENRQTAAVDNVSEGQVSYGYDGLGQRVTKSNNGSVSTIYVYDIFGQPAAEYNDFSTPQSPCATCYLSYDHLGSVRMVTDSAANIISRHDYLPFGEEIPANTAGRRSEWGPFGDKVNQKFTGQERDEETGFDFFQARYFYGAHGRFSSPDPAGLLAVDVTNPQSWNQYSYVWNNPLGFVDPTGTFLDWPEPCDDDPFCGWPPIPILPPVGVIIFGGGGEPPPPPPPPATTTPPPQNQGGVYAGSQFPPGSFPGGENLGLPPGVQVPLPSLAVLLGQGPNINCDFGVCVGESGGLISGFASGARQCGDFLCDANGNPDLTRPHPVGLEEDLTAELLAASAANSTINILEGLAGRSAAQTGDVLFGRGVGLLNGNDYFRIGYGWEGSATQGSNVFRIAIGSKRLPFHWHLTLWRY